MKNPKVSIIVLNYNGLNFLKKCIPTVQNQTYPNIEIIVTDNHSTDGSLEYLSQFPTIVVLKHKKNLGYTKANNLAAKKAKGKLLFFLNNDTELFSDTIEKLVNCYQEKSIVTARQIPTADKKSWGTSGAGMDIFGYPYVEDNPGKTAVFYADGAMFFIKKKDFINLGMFDEKLFIFQEDIDLSWRAQIYGFRIISCWDAKLFHYGGGTILGRLTEAKKYTSSYFRRYQNEKNIIRNIIKNYSFPLVIIIISTLFFLHTIEILVLLCLLKWKVAKCYFEAYIWNLKNLSDTLKFRFKVQKKRKVSDYLLLARMYFTYSKLKFLLKLGMPIFK